MKGIGVQQVNDSKTEVIATLKEIYSHINFKISSLVNFKVYLAL